LKDTFNVVEINAESVYILKVKEKRDRRLHHIEIDLTEKNLEVYNFKKQKEVIYLETNFNFVNILGIQNNR